MRSLEKNNPTAYSPSPGISKSVTCCLKNAKGISVIIHEVVFKKYFEGEGLSILGYRNVPVNKDAIAKHVADTMPVIQQVFIDNCFA
jgi:glutamate synthase domain-containing protein 1